MGWIVLVVLVVIAFGSQRGQALPTANVLAEEVHNGRWLAGVLIVPALIEFVVLLFVQAVDPVIEIVSQVMAGVGKFRLARGQRSRRRKQEGPDYQGVTYPGAFHGSLPPSAAPIWLLREQGCSF